MQSKINQMRMNASFNKQRDPNVLTGKEMKYTAREADYFEITRRRSTTGYFTLWINMNVKNTGCEI